MAWENLSEDIAEEFSDNQQLGYIEGGFSFIRRKGRRGPCPEVVRTRRERDREAKRAKRRWAAFLQLLNGARPWRCAGRACRNLLPIQVYGGGPRQRFCSDRCRNSIHWARLKREQRRRRRIQERIDGIRATRCGALGCCNLLPLSGEGRKPREVCSSACWQRRLRHRNGGTAGGAAGATDGASGPQE